MKKFYTGVVKHRKFVLCVFSVFFLICFVLKGLVAVNYDITDYLPPETASTVSMSKMKEEFAGGIPNTRVMVKDVTIPEALEYKEQFKGVEGVTAVTWLDDSVDVTIPLSTLDESTVELYYKDNAALFTITILEDYRISATDAIREIIGDENYMTGSDVSTAAATATTVSEVMVVTAITIVFVFIVLIFTTSSWLEPILILIGLGVAIMINNGSNLLFGEVSFVTNASGSVLLLAVSLDYSVFLLHRFEECRKLFNNTEDAMIDALCKSTNSILSSGLTTVIGFLALIFMQFQIGPDLGLALAKGVAISLATVFLFMPSLILVTFKWTEKLYHKDFIPSMKGLGKAISKVTVPLCILFAIIIVPSYLGSNANSYLYGSSEIFGADTQYGQDTLAINETFGISDTYVLLVPSGDLIKETALSAELHTLPEVKSIISYVDLAGAEVPTSYLEEAQLSQLMSDNYSRLVLSTSTPTESEETFALVETVRSIADKYYPGESYLAGLGVSIYDLKETVTADMLKVNLLAIGAVFLVLLLTLKSFGLSFILVLSIETAIWLNLSVPYFAGQPIYYIAYLIISSIQLGATVDYAILMTDRYKENRETLAKKEAVIQTISDVFVSIMTSGSTLTVVGFLLGFMSSNQLLAQLGIFIGRGALFSLGIVLLVLPGLLYVSDGVIKRQKKFGTKKEVHA